MPEIFSTSGEKSENAVVPTPQLQGLFVPGIDNPLATDGFGIVTPWGGGGTGRKYTDYGISGDISRQSTQLSDLASSLIPAEGGGGISYGLPGPQGLRGFPGRDGLPGIITVMGLNLPQNTNFLTALPHNIDLINALGTAANKLIYTNAYNTYTENVWTERQPAGDVTGYWSAMDSDSDGSNLIAADFGGRLWTSADSGVNWTERQPAGATNKDWRCVASDSDGTHLIAGINGGRLYTSADSGGTWTERQPAGDANHPWISVDSDSDGSHLVACGYNGRLYTSANFGVDWTERSSASNKLWSSVASDSSGSNLIVALKGGTIYTSINGGADWTARYPAGAGSKNWEEVASDSDGSFLMVSKESTTALYISTNSGVDWTERVPDAGAPTDSYRVACDSDGSHCIASNGSSTYTSSNSGVDWTTEDTADWGDGGVASDNDGSNLMSGGSSGRLFTKGDVTLYSEATWAESALTSAGRAILDDANAAAQATTLGLGTGDSPTWAGALFTSAGTTRITMISTAGVNSRHSGISWKIGPSNIACMGVDDDDDFLKIADGLAWWNSAENIATFDPIHHRVGINMVDPHTTLTVEGAITLQERAAREDNTAAYAQVYAKNDVPNTLWFVNDVGTELRIAPQDLQTSASPTFVGSTLTGKLIAGSFASPVDVTNTRQYGFELHYSGNDYDVTGIRSRARLKTTDTTATAQGALLQAANEDGIDAGVLNGALIEAIGKSDGNAATIAVMRGALVNTEWGDYDTITNLKTLHVRTHSRNAAGAGSFGTGYGIYIENEAVGGNGQAYDAGIYFKGTNLSAGNKAFTYGIDFRGATYGTADIIFKDGTILDSRNIAGGLYGINIETLTGNKTFTPDTDEMYQYLDEGGADRIITLATAGVTAGDRFVIRHNGVHNDVHYLQVKQGVTELDKIYAGGIKEFIFDGTNWISRGLGTGEDNSRKYVLAIGQYARAYNHGTAIGQDSRANTHGTGIGEGAWGYASGAAIGYTAQAYNLGAAVGYSTRGYVSGVAVGYSARGDNYGVAVGREARGMREGVAIGTYAGSSISTGTPAKGNIVIGYQAGNTITTGVKNVLLGYDVDTPAVDTSNFMSLGNIIFATGVDGTGTDVSSGNVGIAEPAPETLTEWTHANPDMTWHGETHSNDDNATAGKHIWKREDGDGTETACFQFEASHDGVVANDQLGKGVWSVNTGAGLVEAMQLDSNGTLSTLFGRIHNTTRLTGNTILDATYHQVFCDTDGGTFTITLPAGIAGTEYRIINTGSSANNLTIAPDGAELLIGVNANWTLFDGESLLIVYEATEGWF